MATLMPLDPPSQGFNFENCKRNAFLAQKGYAPPKVTKTGTTICAVIFKDGVILGADTRLTVQTLISNFYVTIISLGPLVGILWLTRIVRSFTTCKSISCFYPSIACFFRKGPKYLLRWCWYCSRL